MQQLFAGTCTRAMNSHMDTFSSVAQVAILVIRSHYWTTLISRNELQWPRAFVNQQQQY